MKLLKWSLFRWLRNAHFSWDGHDIREAIGEMFGIICRDICRLPRALRKISMLLIERSIWPSHATKKPGDSLMKHRQSRPRCRQDLPNSSMLRERFSEGFIGSM